MTYQELREIRVKQYRVEHQKWLICPPCVIVPKKFNWITTEALI
jgi:hypothetical protein